jgi:hypothetical protein
VRDTLRGRGIGGHSTADPMPGRSGQAEPPEHAQPEWERSAAASRLDRPRGTRVAQQLLLMELGLDVDQAG